MRTFSGLASAEPEVSLPWQLRPVTTSNLARVDTALAAFADDNGNLDVASSTIVGASYQLTSEWAPLLRLGFVGNNAPGAALDGYAFANPVAGATYTRPLGGYRFAVTLATTLPIGTGNAKTTDASVTARPADGAMFDVDYLTEIAGADIAYVHRGFTAQGEATLLPALRVRGGGSDRFRTDAALALHLGYFIGSHVSLGTDLRYQLALVEAAPLDAMPGTQTPLSARGDNALTASLGVRLHFRTGALAAIHPGLSVSRGLGGRSLDQLLIDRPTAVQIDVPVTF